MNGEWPFRKSGDQRAAVCERQSLGFAELRLNPAHDASGRVDIWLNGAFCGAYQGPMADRDYGARRNGAPFSTHSRASPSTATGARKPRRSISTGSCSGTRTRRETRTGA